MCVVSNIMDDWNQQMPKKYPFLNPVGTGIDRIWQVTPDYQPQIDALRKDIEELKKLLKAAKIYDEATDQAECESEEKIALLRKLADQLGIDLEDIV